MQLPPQVFISYNRADALAARLVAMFVVAEGLTVFFDEWTIEYGESISERVGSALSSSTHVVVLWSKSASESGWVKRELNAALARHCSSGTPKLLVVLLDDTRVPTLIADKKYIVFCGGTEQDRFTIIEAIRGTAASDTFTRAIVEKYWELLTTEDQCFRACPGCGSTHVRVEPDWVVDANPGDGNDIVHAASERPTISCSECGLRVWMDELEPLLSLRQRHLHQPKR